MPRFRVRPGFTHGAQKQYKAGDIVELSEEEAAGFLDKLEPYSGKKKAGDEETQTNLRTAIEAASDEELANALGVDVKALVALRQGKGATKPGGLRQGKGATKPGGLVVNPVPAGKSEAAMDVEQELEAETGRDFVQTGATPPTLAETPKPIGGSRR